MSTGASNELSSRVSAVPNQPNGDSDLRLAVSAGSQSYAVAAAELPRSVRVSDSPLGAIVTLVGEGRWDLGVEKACAAGAAAVIVDSPAAGSAGLDLDLVVELSSRMPVVLARPRLRSDVASDALAARGLAPEARAAEGLGGPARISIDCVASTAGYGSILCDAVGWARTLAGVPLEIASAGDTGQSLTALLLSDSRAGASSPAVTILAARRENGIEWLRAEVVGATRTEVVVQGRMHSAEVERADAEGRLRLPTRFESSERLALRRAIAAVRNGSLPADADQLRSDARVASALRDGVR